jgi:hypothetical protein
MTSPSLMAERTGATNSQGVFIARLLPPGNYTIEITAGGFQTARTTRNIGMDQNFQPRIVLQTVAGATVEVIASASSAVDPTSVQTSSNYDASKIDELPVGRDIISMTMMTPGVTQGFNSNDVQIRGGMGSSNLFLLDGQNLMDNVFNSVGFSFISDSFEETQVITGAISAEYGNVDGGVVNTLTKSGGNRFTGQYRVDMSNPAWNATRPWTTFDRYATNTPNPAQIAGGGTPKPRAANVMTETFTYTLGGYFIKDKLWFHVSIYESQAATAGVINSQSTNTGLDGRGANFTNKQEVNRYIGKLSYLVNQDHTIIGTYSWNRTQTGPYVNLPSNPPGEFAALGYQDAPNWMYNFSWRAIWGPSFNTEVRYGAKKLTLATGSLGGDPNQVEGSQVRDIGSGLMYNGGQWRASDPDRRSNQTGNIKASWFANGYGTHELDFGFDYYKGANESANAQGPTNWNFYVYDFDGDNRSAIPYYVIERKDAAGLETTNESMGFYINDKWKLDNHWSFQIGIRWDNYKAAADDVKGTIASSSGFSPRLGVTYDLFGDQTWIFKMSYCRYNAAVMQQITGSVSNVGSPDAWLYYSDIGYRIAAGQITSNAVRFNPDGSPNNTYRVGNPLDLSLYTILADGSFPTIATKIAPNMKNPYNDEFQIGATYSLTTNNYGRGYASLTYVTREWGNLIDYSIGAHGYTLFPGGEDAPVGSNNVSDYYDRLYIEYWDNQPLAKRSYNALEFVADWTYNNLHVGGNITWSELKGNYEGEAGNQPGSGQGINYYREWKMNDDDPVKIMYDHTKTDPVGYLTYHKPLVMTWMADYVVESQLGRTTFGLLYTLEHGRPYTYSRSLAVNAPGGFIPGAGWENSLSDRLWGSPYMFGASFTQMMDNQRTHGKYNTLVYHDLAITQEFNLFKVYDYQVRAFAKLQLRNLFNHMQIYSWNTNYKHTRVTDVDAPWVEGPWNTASPPMGTVMMANYGAARQVLLSAGVRF